MTGSLARVMADGGSPPWPGGRPHRAWRPLVVVLAGHALLLLGWQGATRPGRPETPVAPPAVAWLTLVTPAPPPTAGQPPAPPRPRGARSTPAAAHPAPSRHAAPGDAPAAAEPPGPAEAPPVAPAVPAAEGRASTLRLLDSPATRQALREQARQPLLAERAASATQHSAPTAEQRMADAVSQAGQGDCLKGQYLGGGMGLLSLPFLAGAVVAGRCAR